MLVMIRIYTCFLCSGFTHACYDQDLHMLVKELSYKLNFRNVHGIMNTSGLANFTLTLQDPKYS